MAADQSSDYNALLPWRVDDDGLVLRIRATPKSSRAAIRNIVDLPDGAALAVSITAPPADGAANADIIKLLAKSLGVAKGAVAITSGPAARIKRLHISGDGQVMAARLLQLIGD